MHTVVSLRQRGSTLWTHAMSRTSCRAACTPLPPARTKVSIRSRGSGSGEVLRPTPLSEWIVFPSVETSVTRYPPARPSALATRVAPAKTSNGPTASSGCTPGNTTTTTWRSFMGITLPEARLGVNDIVPTNSAMDGR